MSQRKNAKQVSLSDDNEVLFIKTLGRHCEVYNEKLTDRQFLNMCLTKGLLLHREEMEQIALKKKTGAA